MTRRSLTDLLGDDEPPEPQKQEPVETDWAKLRNGVSVNWLSGFTKLDRKTVKKRLADCPAISVKSGVEKYDPMLALSYLVKPRFDIHEYMKNMNPQDLPPMLRKEYWDAELKKAKWQREAGELWHTSDVLDVLAEAFKRIKTATQMWADDVEREAGLTREQYQALIRRVDVLREDLHKALIQMPAERKTGSVLDEGPMDDIEA